MTDTKTGEPLIGEWDHADEVKDGVGYETWKSVMAGVNANRLHRGMKRVEEKAPPAAERRTRLYLLSGVLRCGRTNDFDEVCFSKLTGNKATGRNAKYGDYYRCGDANCKGVGRRVTPVDKHLEELTLGYLDRHFSGTKVKVVPWRGKEKLAGLRKQLRDITKEVGPNGTQGEARNHRAGRHIRRRAAGPGRCQRQGSIRSRLAQGLVAQW
ncbi:hypothetical protein [Streptomyces sp. NPDC101150]|uniref:hypothetical protein n=1 Tax=Streptomyces sp. NPDC101150 TaxID=3366114 RepID=UPI0038054C99